MLGLGDMNADQLASKLEETLPVIRSVSEQFKDPVSDSSKLVLHTRKRGSVHVIFLLGNGLSRFIWSSHRGAPSLLCPIIIYKCGACDWDDHMSHTEGEIDLSRCGARLSWQSF